MGDSHFKGDKSPLPSHQASIAASTRLGGMVVRTAEDSQFTSQTGSRERTLIVPEGFGTLKAYPQ